MKTENIVHLDLKDCRYLGELHQRIKTTFGFPEYYGENWHAFRDAFITVGLPEKIVIYGEATLPDSLMDEIKRMHARLDEIKSEVHEYGWKFDYKIVD